MKQLLTLFITCALSGSSYAQIATTTSLVGTVSDSSGKVIAGAKITAVNAETLDTYTAVTNQDGNYRIDFVRVGTYDVAAEFAGFARLQHTGSIVTINQIVRNDFTLHPGSVTESISVEAVAPVIKTDDATISATVSSKQIADLPMNGRNALMLATTTPGVLPGTKGTQGVPPGQDFIGAGTREIQNSMSLDGISIMNNLITTSPTQPMVETVQEVEVQTGHVFGAIRRLPGRSPQHDHQGRHESDSREPGGIHSQRRVRRARLFPARDLTKDGAAAKSVRLRVGWSGVHSQAVQRQGQDVLHGIVGAAAQQAAESVGEQHGDDGTDVRGEFLADAHDREGSVEQRTRRSPGTSCRPTGFRRSRSRCSNTT